MGVQFPSIPHRDPFLFVTHDVTMDGPVSVVRARFSPDNPYIGDGSADPVVPRMLVVEAMAQAMAVAANRAYERTQQGLLVMLRNVELIGDVRCSDHVDLRVKHTRTYGSLVRYDTSAQVGDRLVCRGEIMAAHLGDAHHGAT